MDTQPIQPQPTQPAVPELQPKSSSMMPKVLVLVAIVFVAAVALIVPSMLPKQQSTDSRSKAAVGVACGGTGVSASASACNEKCAVDSDCGSGLVCYNATASVDGACRNPQAPEALNCIVPTPTPPTPTPVACAKSCSFSYDCPTGQVCKGTNANNALSISEVSTRVATTTDYSALKADQPIAGFVSQPDATGKATFTVISRVTTTYTVHFFAITGAKGQLNPQTLLLSKEFNIQGGTVVTGSVKFPSCGRYQIDLGSPIVAGTPYQLNPLANYFWGGIFEIPCQNGCCRAQ